MSNETDSHVNADILVVDASKTSRELLIAVLKKAGYNVRFADNAKLALSSVKAKLPTLILLDIMLPDMDGLEVCRKLKSDNTTMDIPIIFISVLEDKASKIKGFQVGGADYINEPFYPEEVLARVNTHISLGQIRIELKNQNTKLLKEISKQKKVEKELGSSEVEAMKLSHNLQVHQIELKMQNDELQIINEELQASEEKYRKLFEDTRDSIFCIDAETGLIVDCNKAAAVLVHREKSKLIGENYMILHPPEDVERKSGENFMQYLREKEAQIFEGKVITSKDEIRYVEISANISEVKKQRIVYAIFHDITERKKNEKELLKKINDLEIFYNASVDRELKMIAMKKRIKELEEKIKAEK